jgi:hypothetical protein
MALMQSHRSRLPLFATSLLLCATAVTLAPQVPAWGEWRPGRGVASTRPVLVKRLAYDKQRHSVVLGVTGNLTVSTRTVASPLRLVVDLPGARLATPNRLLTVNDGLVSRVRVAQFAVWPPVVRVVIEPVGSEEPRLAVQQDGRRLYITVAPAPARESQEALPEGMPTVPALSPAAGHAPEAPPAPDEASPLPPVPGASAVPPLTRPGIQQRLRPPTPQSPALRGGMEAWPTLLPQPATTRAPIPAPPQPASSPAAARPVPPSGDGSSRPAPLPGEAPVLPPGGDEPLETDPFPVPPPPRADGPGGTGPAPEGP